MSGDDPAPPEVVIVSLPSAAAASSATTDGTSPASASVANDPRPVAPAEPEAGDCCGEGCIRCVYDVYDANVERYEAALERWNARHPQP